MPERGFKARPARWRTIGVFGFGWCVAAMAATPAQTAPEPVSAAAPAATDSDRPAAGPDGRCDQCGGCDRVRRKCVKQLTEREVTKVCWGYRCEQICIPGPSVFRGTAHHRDDCGCWTCWLWKPTCAEVITRRVPVKTEVRRKMPAVTWSIEERCCRCWDESHEVGSDAPAR